MGNDKSHKVLTCFVLFRDTYFELSYTVCIKMGSLVKEIVVKKYSLLVALFLWPSLVSPANSIADWTILVCMETMNSIALWGVENINAMATAEPQANINIIVQWHGVQDHITQYQITHNNIRLISTLRRGGSAVYDILDGMRFVVTEFPAKHYGLIVGCHGFGILEPHFTESEEETFSWAADQDEPVTQCHSGVCPLKSIFTVANTPENQPTRALFFNDDSKTFITNQDLITLFSTIHYDFLQGNKLDFFGTDCCKMAMIEVGYQIKDHVNYFIGAQNCELPDGWNFKDFFNSITPEQSARDVVQSIIHTYDQYYQSHTYKGLYTQSACDLNIVSDLSANISVLADLFCKKIEAHDQKFIVALRASRANSLQICNAPFYTDIDSFLGALLNEIELFDDPDSKLISVYARSARDWIQEAVVANSTGFAMSAAKGISIYFPLHHVDHSYPQVLFAQETSWLRFLNLFVNT